MPQPQQTPKRVPTPGPQEHSAAELVSFVTTLPEGRNRRTNPQACEDRWVTRTVIDTLALAGIAGQILLVGAAGTVAAAIAGLERPLRTLHGLVAKRALLAASGIAWIAVAGSLFFSERAHFIPCELCWFQRICMYPIAIVATGAALARDGRAARYLLPLPVLGATVSVYHLLVENGIVGESSSCAASAPGGCATKWIDEFGYVTIPTLALTGFLLIALVLALGVSYGRADLPRSSG